MSISSESIDHIVLNVADVEASAAWYVCALGMQRVDFESGAGLRVALRFGNQKINLRPANADVGTWFTGAAPIPGSADLCFVTQLSPEIVKAHWLARGIAIEAGPVERAGARGPMTSVYCRDPDGNLIEVASYPSGEAPVGPSFNLSRWGRISQATAGGELVGFEKIA